MNGDPGNSSSSTPSSDTTVSVNWLGETPKDVVVPAILENIEIKNELGRGGMGVVFDGWDTVLRRKVAVKFLLGAVPSKDDRHFEQFLKGARAEAAVRHANIVAVHSAGVVNNVPYMVMDHIGGPTLKAISRATGPMEPAAAIKVLADIASAVEALHDRELVHRDLKPANIIFDDQGTLFVTDFGLASLRNRSASPLMTSGTPAYMAPEMFSGRVSPQSDVYAIGILLFELLSGRLPFSGDAASIRAAHAETPLPVAELAGQIPEPLIDILLRATHKREMFRYKSASHLRRALEDSVASPAELRKGAAALKALTARVTTAETGRSSAGPATGSDSSSYFERMSELAIQKRGGALAPTSMTTDGAAPTAPLRSDRDGPPPPWWRVLAAPWTEMRHPTRAASIMIRARRTAFCLSFLLGITAAGVGTVVTFLWDRTYEVRWERMSTRRVLDGGPKGRYRTGKVVRERTVAEVWREAHADGWYGDVERDFLLIVLICTLAAVFVAWLNLPIVHEGGSPSASYERSLRACASCAGFFAVALLLANALQAFASDFWAGQFAAGEAFVMATAIPSCVGLTLWWIGTAVRGTARTAPPVEPGSRCEGCGYDLRYRSSADRCPECGLETAESLTPNLRRTGCAWETRRGIAGWVASSVSALFHPRRFYSRLIMRRSDHAFRRFAAWHYIACGVACGGGTFLFFAAQSPGMVKAVVLAAVALVLFPMFLWAAHRAVAAFVATGWILGKMLPDFRRARRVIEYEVVFVWPLILFGATTLTLQELIRERFTLDGKIPMDLLWFGVLPAIGYGSLLVIWLRRFQIALRAVRWSNF